MKCTWSIITTLAVIWAISHIKMFVNIILYLSIKLVLSSNLDNRVDFVTVESMKSQRFKLIADSINHFGTDLYDSIQMGSNSRSNFLISPFAAVANLIQIGQYTQGSSLNEISTALGLDVRDSELVSDMVSMIDEMVTIYDKALRIINSAFVPNAATVRKSLPTESVYFIKNRNSSEFVEGVMKEVQNSKSSNTREVWESLLRDKTNDVILVNGFHFKSIWKYPFEPSKLSKHNMMTARRSLIGVGYDVEWGARLFKIPFLRNGLSLLMVEPDEDIDIMKIENKIIALRNWKFLLKDMYYIWTSISIPKMVLSSTFSLKNIFKHAGIKTLFGKDCDLSLLYDGSNKTHSLHVSEVIHSVFLDITNEYPKSYSNFVGARGHKLYFNDGATSRHPLTIKPPFLYIVYHDKWGALLHGRQYDVQQKL